MVMTKSIAIPVTLLVAGVSCFFGPHHLRGQQPARPSTAPAPAAKGAAPAPAKAPAPMDAEKSKILASEPWKQVMSEYQKWVSSQPIYTTDDVKRMNAKISAAIASMSASDLQEYLDDWQAKLKVLNGQNFQDAQAWLGAYLEPCTDGYRAKTLKQLGLTDVANMSAKQLEDAIVRIRADRLSREASQAAFEQSRASQVRMLQQDYATSQQALQQASGAQNNYGYGPGFNTMQSPYHPPKFNPPPQPRMHFYVNGQGQIGYLLPF
jgi:hypothetical protein